MNKPRAFVWGASGHAKVVADAAMREERVEVVGFFEEMHGERAGQSLAGLTVFGGAKALDELQGMGATHVLLGVGNCAARSNVARRAVAAGFELATVRHPSSVVASDVTIGAGTVLFAGAIVNPGSQVGSAVILNTACSVDHDCMIGDGVHLSPGVHLAGNVHVGEQTWVGIGSSVIQGIKIGARSTIGAGSVVVRDLPSGVTAFGVPCKIRT